jgi:superfamily I DNA/RNA helicase
MAEYYFNLPQITQLTISQQAALNETKQIALSGGPGTGKSVVSLWRHISNYQRGKKSLLLTYTTTLARYLSACCKAQNENAVNNVKTSLRGKPIIGNTWHEIIVDEAQDLPIDYYNDIKSIANVSYGADDSQILYPDKSSSQQQLKGLFSENVDYILDKNFRSTQRIMQFAKVAFPNAYIPRATIDGLSNNVGELPIMLITGKNEWNDELDRRNISNNKQDNSIIEIINSFRSDTHNIAILVPFKKDAQAFEDVLNKNNIADFSIYYEDRGSRFPNGCEEIKNVHITTFKSAKGLEFDTVIIPNFHKYPEICSRPYKIEWKDYYVGITRARSNLYLISNYDNKPELNSVTDKSII